MRILIIDQDSGTHEVYKQFLDAYNECVFASSSIEGLTLFNKELKDLSSFDIVIVDQKATDFDGIYTAQILRMNEDLKGVTESRISKIVMTSGGDTDIRFVKEALSKGCNGFMLKPLNKDVFRKALAPLGVKIDY